MRQIDISVIINSLGKGGAEKLASLIFPRLVQSKLSSQLLVLSDHENVESYLQNLQMVKQQMTILHNANLYKVGLIKTIAHFAKDSKVVHCHLFPAVFWVILAKKLFRLSGKIVYTEHGIVHKKNNAIRKIVIRWIYKNCDTLIALTEEMKSKMLEFCSQSDKIQVIENGIDIESIKNTKPIAREQLYQIKGVQPTAKHFLLMTARFEPQKDHFTLIKSMQHLDPSIVLLLAGEGEIMSECEALVDRLNLSHRVFFLGFRNDVISIMKTVDINILSTHFEGLSGVVLESLAAGKPFLGTNVPGVSEVCPDDNFRVNHLSEEQLCEKINFILSNTSHASQMVAKASEHINKYSLERMFELHLNLYNNLLGRNF